MGKEAEFWHADTGLIEPASYRIADGRTMIPVSLAADDSVFIIFRSPAASASRSVPPVETATLKTLGDRWHLSFQAGRGAPTSIDMTELGSWSQSEDFGVKYFSGTGTYTQSIDLSSALITSNRRLLLDLGEVHDVPSVTINGRDAGTVWKSPFRLDVTSFRKSGRNEVEVRVTNLWVNRLIGDAQPGAHAVASTTGPPIRQRRAAMIVKDGKFHKVPTGELSIS